MDMMLYQPMLHPSSKQWINKVNKTYVVDRMKLMYKLSNDLAALCGQDGSFIIEEQTLGLVAFKNKGDVRPFFTNRPMTGNYGKLVMVVNVVDLEKRWWSACPNIDKIQSIAAYSLS
jgi:hypothetical protein